MQQGIRLDPATGDEGLDRELKGRWKAWSEDPDACDVTGRFPFHRLAQMVLRNIIVDGDCLVLPLKSGEVEIVEAHWLRSPRRTRKNVVLGVLKKLSQKRL